MAKKTSIMDIVLYGLALCMGLVSVLLFVLAGQGIMEFDTDTLFVLMGIGVFCLGLAGLNKVT